MNVGKQRIFHRLLRRISKCASKLKRIFAQAETVSPSGTEGSRMKLGRIESMLTSYEVFRALRKGSHSIYYIHHDRYKVSEVAILVALGRESWRVSQIAIEAYPDREQL